MRIISVNDDSNKWRKVFVLSVVLFFQAWVIFLFSLQDAEHSSELSRPIMNSLTAVPDFIPRERSNGRFFGITLHYIVRKIAHMYNFFVIGCVVYSIRLHFEPNLKWDFLFLTYGVFIASVDETIQRFVPGRTGTAVDVCVDFSGMIIGYMFLFALSFLCFHRGVGREK